MADMYSHRRRRVFDQAYRCYSPSSINNKNIESGDKILMPLSALELLTYLRTDYPMLFELRSTTTEHVTHCGVLEFTAEEGTICMPTWMMQNLKLQEGYLVRAKSVALPKGTYMKLQPHTTDFIDISNPRAVLEVALRGFSCLTIGDTIMVTYNSKKYYIDIVEAKPASGISVIDTDCEVDFAPPLDYKEPERPQVSSSEGPVRGQDQAEAEPKYRPFSGVGRRLDGKASKCSTQAKFATLGAEVPLSEATGSGGKKSIGSSRQTTGSLVFGSKASVSKESKVPSKEREEPEKQEPTFQAFTGRKYSLLD